MAAEYKLYPIWITQNTAPHERPLDTKVGFFYLFSCAQVKELPTTLNARYCPLDGFVFVLKNLRISVETPPPIEDQDRKLRRSLINLFYIHNI